MTSTNAIQSRPGHAVAAAVESMVPVDRRRRGPATVISAIFGHAAVHGDAGAVPLTTLAEAWTDFACGSLHVAGSCVSGERVYVLAHALCPGEGAPLSPTEAQVFARVLCGEQQKVVAADLSIAPSTASHRCLGALRKLGVGDRPVPLPLVIAAQHAAGVAVDCAPMCFRFEREGRAHTVFSVRRPDMRSVRVLSPAEREIACSLIEGGSRSEIAYERGTSSLTVAGQIHAIFAALRSSGRNALIRRAGEMACFEGRPFGR